MNDFILLFLAQTGVFAVFAALLTWLGKRTLDKIKGTEDAENRRRLNVLTRVLDDEYRCYQDVWSEMIDIFRVFASLDTRNGRDPKAYSEAVEEVLNRTSKLASRIKHARPFIDDDFFNKTANVCIAFEQTITHGQLLAAKNGAIVEQIHKDNLWKEIDLVCYQIKGRVHAMRADARTNVK